MEIFFGITRCKSLLTRAFWITSDLVGWSNRIYGAAFFCGDMDPINIPPPFMLALIYQHHGSVMGYISAVTQPGFCCWLVAQPPTRTNQINTSGWARCVFPCLTIHAHWSNKHVSHERKTQSPNHTWKKHGIGILGSIDFWYLTRISWCFFEVCNDSNSELPPA
jgi:hypothetical protein